MNEDKFNKSRKYLEKWLKRSQEASDIAPRVKQYLDIINWESRTISNRPSGTESISTFEVDKHADRVYGVLTTNLPMLPEINQNFNLYMGTSTVSSSSAVVSFVSSVSHLDTPESTAFASKALEEFNQIQQEYKFPNEIRLLVNGIIPDQKERFNAASTAYDKYISGHAELTTVALEMRTFIDGVKGELFKRARQHNNENMNYKLVYERLYINIENKIEVEEQINQHSVLVGELSELAKRRKTTEVKALWMKILNYTYILLSPIKNDNR